jgi:hypothetical protein
MSAANVYFFDCHLIGDQIEIVVSYQNREGNEAAFIT